jgi:repressor LexA
MTRDLEAATTQRKILTMLLEAFERDELPPTLEEFASKLGLRAKSNVRRALIGLEDKGFIEFDRGSSNRVKTRSIRLTKVARARPIPLVGTVAAGQPILVDGENVREYLPLPAEHVRGAEVYMLEVDGDSMAGDGVLKGDYVIVDRYPSWEEGDMVVVLHKNAATVKRVWREGSSIHLESSNPKYDPIILEEGDDREDKPVIQGRVIGVVRWQIQQGRRNRR